MLIFEGLTGELFTVEVSEDTLPYVLFFVQELYQKVEVFDC